jgi:hypothetical protein
MGPQLRELALIAETHETLDRHPPPYYGGEGGMHRTQSEKIKKTDRKISIDCLSFSPAFSLTDETKAKYLIHICEEKGYYFSSHTYRKGFSRVRSDSR